MQCESSDEKSRSENDFEENDFFIYYNWHATEWGFIHLHFNKFKMLVFWYDDKKDSGMKQTEVIFSFFITNH